MPEQLSYQRLLEITGKLNGDEQEYVMRFLSSNDRKTRAKVTELERERKTYTDVSKHLKFARDEADTLSKQNTRLAQENNDLQVKFQNYRENAESIGKRRRFEMLTLEHLVRQLLCHPELLRDTEARNKLLAIADSLTETLKLIPQALAIAG